MLEFTGKQYLLRWRYDFRGKAPIFGMWNNPGITAWDRNGEGLATASIEAKDIVTKEIKRVVEVQGHVFRNFQWLVVARVNLAAHGSQTPFPEHVGLKIITTHEEVAVLINGQIGRRLLTEEEKGLHFATDGR